MVMNRVFLSFFIIVYMFGTALSKASAVVAATPVTSDDGEGLVMAASDDPTPLESRGSSPLRRLLAGYNPRASMTCNKYPKVCHSKGSPGHDCCKKRCVNLKEDSLNCGQCGRKCKYGEACCHGRCVNVTYDRKNCGGCHKKCKKGSYCRYGMCSYA